jgi:hypothetical protein
MPTFETEKRGMRTANLWIGVLLGATLLYSCSKTDYNSTPTITYKSVNQTLVPWNTGNSLVVFSLELSEKSYNANDSLYVFISVPNCEQDSGHLAYSMTSLASGIPPTTGGGGFKATMTISFSNGQSLVSDGYPDIEDFTPCTIATSNGLANQNDTATFYFCVGQVGHYSDTAKAGPVVLENPPY